ncbi:GNAT family N-acetyltransferase [Psychrobacter sp. I-STPA10]|uniref:GNAT family N-acetyltransferase n=1 Tax=Psychrobacter sp. I-STPA10 TaxID=2585769 RepID=UPI001E558498|nr:GNAT family N-acetyltransferase [Psychrobacter sp. I-STPA10]
MPIIKPLAPNDHEHWLRLWQGYLDFYQTTLSDAVIDNTWQRIISNDSDIYGFGAWIDKEDESLLVGLVHVVLHPNTWNASDCCYLEDLYVGECVRGQGVGRALIEQVYTFAQSKHCNRVYWVTQAHNTTARKLYDTLATKTDMVQYRHDL